MRLSLLVTFLLLLSLPQAWAQFKNSLLDPGSSSNCACEPSIAINLDNPKNIVAASAMNNVYFSSNGGLSWKKSTLTSPYGVWGDPAVISDFKGNFYYFHLSDPTGKNWKSDEVLDRIVVQESNDGGETWSEGASIGLNSPKDQGKEWAAADRKGNLYVTWTQFDKYGGQDPGCQSAILMSRSSGGKKWSKPFQISQLVGDCKDDDNTPGGAVPVVSADGKQVFVAWAHEQKIFFDRSFDGGITWLTNDLNIADQPGGWSMRVPGINRCSGLPILICDNTKKGTMSGALYVVWADQRNGENDTDIWFMRSMNFGDNWTQPFKINDDGMGKHQFFPWMTIDPATGYIYIVYYDRRNYDNEQTDVYVAYSTDAGGSFRNVKISEKPFLPKSEIAFGDHINISANQGIIAAIWTRMDNGQTSTWTAVIKHEDLAQAK